MVLFPIDTFKAVKFWRIVASCDHHPAVLIEMVDRKIIDRCWTEPNIGDMTLPLRVTLNQSIPKKGELSPLPSPNNQLPFMPRWAMWGPEPCPNLLDHIGALSPYQRLPGCHIP